MTLRGINAAALNDESFLITYADKPEIEELCTVTARVTITTLIQRSSHDG